MTDVKTLIINLKKLNLPSDQYIVIGGAVLTYYGIRQTTDVDLIARPKLFTELRAKYPNAPLNYRNCIELEGGVEIGCQVPELPQTAIDDFFNNAQIVDGLPFASLEDIIKFKTALGRSKDLIDIVKIKKFVNKDEN